MDGYQVLGVCNPFYDRSCSVEDRFLDDHGLRKGSTAITFNNAELTEVSAEGSLGGSGTNVIKTLAHLGNRCAILGKIGIDSIGEQIKQHLARIGVTSLLVDGKNPTGIVNCFVTPDYDRTMQAYLGASIELSERDISKKSFQGVKHVHLEGYVSYFPGVVSSSIRYAQEHGAKTSFDLASSDIVEQFKSQLEEDIPKMDIVFGNEQEMKIFTGSETLEGIFDRFDSTQTVVVTRGEEGCWVKKKGSSEGKSYTAIPTPELKDTTGAGDFFAGGFLHGTFLKRKTGECVKIGSRAAHLVIQEIGANLPESGWQELRDFTRKA